MPPRVYLIRHGETEWSRTGQHTGRTDIPLTQRGEQAARQVGERLRGVVFRHVFTSPLRRARQTCELAGYCERAAVEPDLAEWDYGDYEGLTSAKIAETNPQWNVFRDGAPGGESPEQVTGRVDRLIAQIRTLDGDAALFGHGHIGRALAARWIELPVEHGQRFLLDTAAVCVLGYDHGRADQPALELWNSTPE
ncbi:MAG: histidine phosphatase family protein [Acidobacteria bacterium]|nr:histidine phosphatase family protein [Acidobacteriota bacterium]